MFYAERRGRDTPLDRTLWFGVWRVGIEKEGDERGMRCRWSCCVAVGMHLRPLSLARVMTGWREGGGGWLRQQFAHKNYDLRCVSLL